MEKYNQIFNDIFKQSLFEESSKALVEKITHDYPYFSPANLFLLHLTDKNSGNYAEQAKKTSLLFNNNYWLNFQLLELSNLAKRTSNNDTLSQQVAELPEVAITLSAVETNESTKESNSYLPDVENEEPVIFNGIIEDNNIEEQPIITAKAIEEGNNFGDDVGRNATELMEALPEVLPDDAENQGKNIFQQIEAVSTIELDEPIQNNTESQISIQEQDVEIKIEADELPIEEVALPVAAVESLVQQDVSPIDEDELPIDEEDFDANNSVQPVDDQMKMVSLKIAETLSAITTDSIGNKDTIPFEPLHTSDYFASVGIKLSEEIKPSDKLGLQLKSFTQWLKTMKKIHEDQLRETGFTDAQINIQNEKTIQLLAEASNKENQVVTEAMAEVLVQQGKIMKAVEVYEKLSLLDPSKKVYFAAKLNQLKG